MIHEPCLYQIEVRGQVSDSELNAMSPLQTRVMPKDTATTLLTVHTDQAGLIGLLRHLHGRGFVFLSVQREW